MSFVIHIWKQPEDLAVPTTPFESQKIIDTLFKRRDPVPPEFAVLSKRLISLHPWMDEDDENAVAPHQYKDVFIDGWEGETEDAVWNMGIYGDDPAFTAIYYAIVYDAVSCGLNVSDPQNGLDFLAGFKVLAIGEVGAMACTFAEEARMRGHWTEAFQRYCALADEGNICAAQPFADLVQSGAGDKRESLATSLAILWSFGMESKVKCTLESLPKRLQALTLSDAKEQVRRIKAEGLLAVIDALPGKQPEPGEPQIPYEAIAQRLRRYPIYNEELLAAAKGGDARACNALALRFWSGSNGQVQNPEQAVYWWLRASEGGLAAADARLGVAFFKGVGAPRDLAQARLRLVSAANRGSGLAFYLLSRMVERGEGAPHVPALAQALMVRARELGAEHVPPEAGVLSDPEVSRWLSSIGSAHDLNTLFDELVSSSAGVTPVATPNATSRAADLPEVPPDDAPVSASKGSEVMLAGAALAGGILVLALMMQLSLGVLMLPLWGFAAVLGAAGCYRAGGRLGDSMARRIGFALAALLPMFGFFAVCWVGFRYLREKAA